MKTGDTFYLAEKRSAIVYEGTLQDTDTCIAVILDRFSKWIHDNNVYLGIQPRCFGVFSKLPKKYVKREIVKFE